MAPSVHYATPAPPDAPGPSDAARTHVREALDPTAGDLLGVTLALHSGVIGVHDLISEGIPMRAYQRLLEQCRLLPSAEIARATGVSIRTAQRRAKTVDVPLSPEQSGRTWKFAEVLAQATGVFGSRERAEQWLNSPARTLEHRRPIELLSTPVGIEAVQNLLGRIEHGVYT